MTTVEWFLNITGAWLFISFILAVAVDCFVLSFSDYNTEAQRKAAARMIWLCWLWPVFAVVFAVKGVRWLWETADWKGGMK